MAVMFVYQSNVQVERNQRLIDTLILDLLFRMKNFGFRSTVFAATFHFLRFWNCVRLRWLQCGWGHLQWISPPTVVRDCSGACLSRFVARHCHLWLFGRCDPLLDQGCILTTWTIFMSSHTGQNTGKYSVRLTRLVWTISTHQRKSRTWGSFWMLTTSVANIPPERQPKHNLQRAFSRHGNAVALLGASADAAVFIATLPSTRAVVVTSTLGMRWLLSLPSATVKGCTYLVDGHMKWNLREHTLVLLFGHHHPVGK